MYKKDRARTRILYIGGSVAIAVCAAVIAFLVHSMALRNSYRAMCLEINDAVLTTPDQAVRLGRNGEEYPADGEAADYYNRFLLSPGTLVFDRRTAEPDDRTIVLRLGEKELLFTGLDNDTAVNIRWTTPEGTESYTVRATSSTFPQLSAYYSNFARRASAG